MDYRDKMDNLDPLDRGVPLGLQEIQVLMEILVKLVNQVQLEKPDH